MTAHCPHCGIALPGEEPGAPGDRAAAPDERAAGARFCPACGRRVEGWRAGARASLGGAAVGAPLPGGEEPTRAVAPSPSLLRAIVAHKDAPAANEPEPGPTIPPRRARRLAALALALGGVALAAVGVALVLRPRAPAPVHVPPPAPMEAPTVAAAPVPPPLAPLVKKHGKARRISAPPIAPAPIAVEKPAKAAKSPAPAAGALPHKAAKGESLAVDTAALPSGTAAPPAALVPPPAAPPTLPVAPTETAEVAESGAPPATEADRRAEAAARADADGVRFVVHAHLAQVQACYGRVFKDGSPGGRVDVGFTIAASGRATQVHTESNTSGSTALARCLEQRIAEWEFPRPSNGEFELIYPFVFSQGS